MCNHSKNCFFCLSKNNTLTNNFHLDESYDIIKLITYVLPELTILKSEVPVHICSSCHERLQSFYTFKKMCLDNNTHFQHYILQEPHIYSNQTFNELPKNINDSELIKVEPDINIKEDTEDPVAKENQEVHETIDDIYVKEENIVFEDGVVESTNYHQLGLDCLDSIQKVTQDSEQTKNDSQSFCQTNENIANNSNLVTSLLYSKFAEINKDEKEYKCLICNQQFSANSYLKNHVKMHLGIKNVICKPKKSRRKPIKRKKNLNCPVCNKEFLLKKNLKIHIKYHGIKKFSRSYNLRSKVKSIYVPIPKYNIQDT